MKKVLLSLFCLLFVTAVSEVKAQSTTASAKTKDEYWGTSKAQTRGTGEDGVGKRTSGLNARFNEYGNPSKTDKMLSNTKRMKAIQEKEKKMLKKHAREKRKFERQRKRRN